MLCIFSYDWVVKTVNKCSKTTTFQVQTCSSFPPDHSLHKPAQCGFALGKGKCMHCSFFFFFLQSYVTYIREDKKWTIYGNNGLQEREWDYREWVWQINNGLHSNQWWASVPGGERGRPVWLWLTDFSDCLNAFPFPYNTLALNMKNNFVLASQEFPVDK